MLRRFYPSHHGTYFEPFLGSGAVFFDLWARGAINGGGAVLTDDNPDLIGCYQQLQKSLDSVIAQLEELSREHRARGRDFYWHVRDERFNPLRLQWHRAGADPGSYPVELAAMLIYLNRTGYNGLFRLNASGVFNVPPGRYDRPRILNRNLLMNATRALSAGNIRIARAGYAHVINVASSGDFVYLDPPYAPVSRTANFGAYTGRGFSDVDQEALQQTVIALAARGVHVLLSNSTAPVVTALYERNPDVDGVGLRSWRVPARRAVNSNAAGRGQVEELLVSNVCPLEAPSPV